MSWRLTVCGLILVLSVCVGDMEMDSMWINFVLCVADLEIDSMWIDS